MPGLFDVLMADRELPGLLGGYRPRFGRPASVGYDFNAAPLSPAIEELKAQRGQPGVIQKTLGMIPALSGARVGADGTVELPPMLDEDGKRGAQSWRNAMMSTLQFPIDAAEGIGQALTSVKRAWDGKIQMTAPDEEGVWRTSPEAIGEGVNFSGNAMMGGIAAPKPSLNASVKQTGKMVSGWHGNGRELPDGFSSAYAGRGQGDATFGPGVYIAGTEDLGAGYAKLAAHNGKPGFLHKVETGIDEGKMLDFDLPMSQQSPHVMSALSNGANDALGIPRWSWGSMEKTAGDYITARMRSGDDYALSQGLQKSGIPGIKYANKNAVPGDNPSNYVILDHSAPKVTETTQLYANGGRSGAAAGAAAGALDQPHPWSTLDVPPKTPPLFPQGVNREWLPGGERVEIYTPETKPYASGGTVQPRLSGFTDEPLLPSTLQLKPRSDGSGEWVWPFTEPEEQLVRQYGARGAPDLYTNGGRPGALAGNAASAPDDPALNAMLRLYGINLPPRWSSQMKPGDA